MLRIKSMLEKIIRRILPPVIVPDMRPDILNNQAVQRIKRKALGVYNAHLTIMCLFPGLMRRVKLYIVHSPVWDLYFYLIEKPAFKLYALRHRKDLVLLPCHNPFAEIEILPDGGCTMCCSGWLPLHVGNIKTKSIEAVFNSVNAQRIRMTIYRNKLCYCNKRLCNTINSKNFRLKTVDELADNGLLTDEVKKAMSRRSLIMPHGPSEMMDCFSTVCNISCKFCSSIHHKREPKPEMEKVMAKYIAGNAEKIRRISFCGGEPLVQKYVIEMIKMCYGRNPDVDFYITTNLVSLSKDIKDVFEKINLRPLHISLNAASASGYASVVDGANWERVYENFLYIAELRRRRPDNCVIDASMVVTSVNYQDIMPFAVLCLQYGVRRIEYYPLNISPQNAYLQLQETEKNFIREILKMPLFEKHKDRLEIGPLLKSIA